MLAPFAALSASYFAHIGFFNPYLPLWLKELGLPLLAISLLTSAQAATRLFAPYAWGAWSDASGERVRLLRFSATVALLTSTALWMDLGVVGLGVVLLVMFTHTSSMMPMSEAAMAHLVSQGGSFDSRRYGRVRVFGSIGFLVTVFAAGWWFERFGMRHFPAWTVLTLLAVTVSVWCLPDVKEGPEPAARQGSADVLPVLRRPVVRWFFAAAFFHVLSHVGLYVFFSLYLDALGYAKSTIGMLWAVSVVVEIGWFFTQSRWLARGSLTGWLAVCSAACAVRMAMTAAFGSVPAVLVVAQVLHALTFAAHHTLCIVLLSHYFPGPLRGRGQALYTVAAYGVPGVLGGLAGGLIAERFGLVTIYWVSCATSIAAVAAAWQVRRLERATQKKQVE